MLNTIFSLVDRLAFAYTRWRVLVAIKNDESLTDIEKTEFEQAGQEASVSIMAESPAVPIFAEQCAALLNRHSAKNYVEIVMMPSLTRNLRPVVITVRWKDGMTPSTRAEIFENALRDLVKDIEEYPGHFDADTESVCKARAVSDKYGHNPKGQGAG